MEIKELLKKINALAQKKRTEGLTADELIEQQELYKEYLGFIKGQVKQQLDNIEIVDAKDLENTPKKEVTKH